jgi:hypothetical protein
MKKSQIKNTSNCESLEYVNQNPGKANHLARGAVVPQPKKKAKPLPPSMCSRPHMKYVKGAPLK